PPLRRPVLLVQQVPSWRPLHQRTPRLLALSWWQIATATAQRRNTGSCTPGWPLRRFLLYLPGANIGLRRRHRRAPSRLTPVLFPRTSGSRARPHGRTVGLLLPGGLDARLSRPAPRRR